MGREIQGLVGLHATHKPALQYMAIDTCLLPWQMGEKKGIEDLRVERSSLLWVDIPAIGVMFKSVAPQWWVSVHGSLLPVENTGMSEAMQIWPHPSLDTALWTAGPATCLLWGGVDGMPSLIATFCRESMNSPCTSPGHTVTLALMVKALHTGRVGPAPHRL